jgi:hypothetical protein
MSADADKLDLIGIKVDFRTSEGGPVIVSTSFVVNESQKSVSLPFAVREYVLGVPTASSYWYQITAITSKTEFPGEWTANRGDLFITHDKLSLPQVSSGDET